MVQTCDSRRGINPDCRGGGVPVPPPPISILYRAFDARYEGARYPGEESHFVLESSSVSSDKRVSRVFSKGESSIDYSMSDVSDSAAILLERHTLL